MPYEINRYSGVPLVTVNDGTVDNTATTLKLVGKGSPEYGEAIAENFVFLTENFASETEPETPIRGQFWYHLNGGGNGDHILKVCRSDLPNIEWSEVSTVPITTNYVQKSGDQMSGPLLLDGDPIAPNQAANKQYVDDKIANILSTSGGLYARIAGDTMTGYLNLHADPVAPAQAATKQYVDIQINQLSGGTGSMYLRTTGGTMTGYLSLNNDPIDPYNAATKQYVDVQFDNLNSSLNNKVSRSGDIMSGDLTLPNDPTANLHAATKQYVDATASEAVTTFMNMLFPVGTMIPIASQSFVEMENTGYWLVCDGRAISRTTYAALFAAVAERHGPGDGSTTFNIPDMRGRVIMGANDTLMPNGKDATMETYNVGNKYGSEYLDIAPDYATAAAGSDVTTIDATVDVDNRQPSLVTYYMIKVQ